ncbi:MAG: tail fiber domain-containing protein [Ferruginibacter sp.]
MKKQIFLLASIILFFATISYEQVGVGTITPHPSSKLDITSTNSGLLIPRMTTAQRIIIPSPAMGLEVFDKDTKSFWFWDGSGWVEISTGTASNFWSQNGSDIYYNTGGNVGIGTTTPANKLTVQTQTGQFGFMHTDGAVILASYIGIFQGALGGWLGTRTSHPLYFYTNNSAQQMTLLPNGNFGIGIINPTNKLQINGATPGFNDYDFAIGRNGQSMGIYQGPNFTNLQSTANISINPKNATGFVGINVGGNPSNRLQIGTMGTAPFSGNDLAIGNGANALAVYQSNATTQFASTTDIVFLPRYGSTGRIGINTTTPRCPLEVAGFASSNINSQFGDFAYFALGHSNFHAVANTGGVAGSGPVNVSIYASDRIVGLEFNAFSDARIKNIISRSNSAEDLETIGALQVTNYTLKDHVKQGEKLYKKVIAQEVEEVYPQAVSKHTDYIPNVYQATSKIERTKDGYQLTFSGKHNISKAAKKLRVLLAENEGMQGYDIIAVPSSNQVVISAPAVKTEMAFVYGEEVDDFRTVDYEGLAMLNISATQELNKLVKMQQAQIDEQNKKIKMLVQAINILKSRPTGTLPGR